MFAVYNDEKVQAGCQLGRLDILHNKGATITLENGGGHSFFEIQNRFCMYCRNPDWAKKLTPDRLIKQVEDEVRIQYQAIIIANESLEDVKKTVNSILGQSLKANNITVVRPSGNTIRPSHIIPLLKNFKGQWRVENIEECMLPEEMIDIVFHHGASQYYSVFRAGFEVPDGTFEQLNKLINDELLIFAMIAPNSDGNGLIVSREVHLYYQGNKLYSLEQKIKEDECQNLIYPIHQLIPDFPR